jgi:hypothetical protein
MYEDKSVKLCRHCDIECGGHWCKNCGKAEDRREMDKENKKIDPNFVCKVCNLGWYSLRVQTYESGIIERVK